MAIIKRLILGILVIFCVLSLSSSSCSIRNQSDNELTDETTQVYQEKYLKSESFIKEGVRYWFNCVLEWQNTIPITHIKYDHGEIIINRNNLRMIVDNDYCDFHIDKAIYEKLNKNYQDDSKDVWATDRAQFVLSSGKQKFYAYLELGYSQRFQLSNPTTSNIELKYYPDEESLMVVLAKAKDDHGISYTFDIQR